ncbi:carbohydrate kinase [Actinophytocola xinjiangensis]|uniref:Carbohydrate kinase n=1 Tax=Actinophytocola xinjiangensis TaxID=485602 RepID=A0A7Z0WRS4_9PSEU|nr:FGGY-family carbohydrate kinase [Actinophytocola xinjiangensis]OLF14148.1 carbohydrate kinase [Actinophytocola xinjiangensis]
MATVAIDAGTSMIKAVVFDDDGTEIAVARQPTTVHRPHPGWAEQDMRSVWDAATTAVRTALSTVNEDITFLAITAQGDGCWLVDAHGQPTGPAILWSDGRAASIVETWRDTGVTEQAFRINGSLGFSGLPHAILTWLDRHDPDRLRDSATALYCGGWLYHQATGRLTADLSDASTPFLDATTRRYSPDLLALHDLDWAARLLPDLTPSHQRAAPLTATAAHQLGLPAGTPVVLAPYDIAATALGAGATQPGQAATILGTTLCTEIVRDRPDTTGTPAGLTVALDTATDVLRAYPTLAGTEVLDWATALLGLNHPRDLADLAESAPPRPDDPLLLPYLSPAGERAPFLNPHARGTFWGLTLEHQRPHVARAVFDGLTMVIRDCLDHTGTDLTELRVTGGGARNPFWCQLIADVTGLPVATSTDTEVGAKGAHLTGLVATGTYPTITAAANDHVRITGTHHPDATRHQHHTHRYDLFQQLRATTTPGWTQHAKHQP